MCGIAGVYLREQACNEGTLTAMRDTLVHRGPDAAGNFVEGPVGLGHRRLSIIDLASGQQPMFTADERFVIVYNGEIYNYRELRGELEKSGAHFKTHSDTEVILQLHQRNGDRAVEQLNGIFAYALYDRHSRRLLLTRDRAGIKPLYYTRGAAGLAFGSEIKALFSSGVASARLDPARVAEYLTFRQVAGPHNLFAGVEVLPPGHTMAVTDGAAEAPRRFWTARRTIPRFAGSFRDAVDALDATLDKAVARQLMADVPLGTFCSGGLDSSLTTAIASKHASKAINTFSVGFHEADYDESAYARLAAESCGTTHHELRIDEREYAELLPKLIWHHDLPLNYANSVHIYAVSQLARRHVTVVLTGEGADELFGGYPRYYIPRLLKPMAQLPGFVRNGAVRLLAKAPDHRLRKLADFAGRSGDDILLYNCTGTDPRAALAAVGSSEKSQALEFRRECIAAARALGLDDVSTLAQLDFQTYLVSILNRQDKMSMATSIEARVPFLDNEVIDLAASLPLEYKQTLRHRKRVLKEVALRYLPPEIIHRRKSGFGVPLAPWFAGSGPMRTLLDEAIASSSKDGLLDGAYLQGLAREHAARAADHSELLWGVLNLQLWRRAYGL